MDDSATSMTPQQALSLALQRMGGQSALARLCDVAQSTVWEWVDRGKELPAEHVLKVEAATHVSRSDLRPDLYPRGLQDGIPFAHSSGGVAAIGELAAGASPEWPVAQPDGERSENSAREFQDESQRGAA